MATKKEAHPLTMLTASKTTLTSIELFAGAGGSALGFHNAGINSKLLVDFDKSCVATMKKNMPKWNVELASVVDLDLSEYRGKIDVMVGGFPCQSFSYAGHRLGLADIRGTLFYEYARLIDQVRPRLVVGENVKGLLTHDDGKTLKAIVAHLESLGYRVAYKVLRSQYLDVPQKRERLVIFGLREDQPGEILFPVEKDYIINLREALKAVPKSPGTSYSPAKKAVMDLVPQGGYWRDLPLSIQKSYMGGAYESGGGKTGMARRLSWDQPSLTLTCSPTQKQTERCHPSQTRPLTVREYARIQTFPDSWEFAGSVSSNYKQIGNAVPVNLGFHIALAVRAMLRQPSRSQDAAKLEPLPVKESLNI